ncbi:hypothetical protein TEA_004959 [Camellia sinensis var. sinensis]|uniref:non-specific serine/threonine protein kinase n=1 Tax=Camellia sinensis var. sinensis TaxID=542762 RepID=A0A4S4ELR3_CAMSN|nr:hypothetical protein TEA_004959 [Camellia sinensis var. sinensis]
MGTRSRSACTFLSFPLLLYFLTIPSECATDTLTHSQPISVGQTLISAGEVFELGFFSPGNSSKLYIGLWYNNITVRKIVWVANRENPLPATDSASSLIIGSDGTLRLLDGMRNTFWFTNVSLPSNNTIAVLLDKGDFVLKDNVSGFITWESFNYPCDTFLAGMMIGLNTKIGEKHFLSSWETDNDPSPGKFVLGLTPETPPQLFLWNNSKPYWRDGPWDGWTFIGIPNIGQGYVNGFILILDNEQGTANKNGCPICECLKGFVPKSTEDWSKGNWTGGCVRRTELLCQKNISRLANGTAQNDGFWKLSGLKLPDHFEYLFNQDYSDLVDVQQFSTDGNDLFLHLAYSELGQGAEEFKNEIKLISKWQHRNLVRLLGYCIDGEEKLLVYEYMTNRSLDMFLFDAKKRMQLDWAKRFNIIQGIARGILYLHCDSCLRVIHRDLKASNILLDDDMNPKISDFGLARTFQLAQELANTHRVMGTFKHKHNVSPIKCNGYMSHEYAMGGLFLEKSDVFSFGVLLLEIVSSTRNTSLHYNEKYLNLLGYAWQLCNKNRELELELMDEAMAYSCSRSEVMRCIHIGLLCVQDHVTDRPTMSAVVLMLSSEMDLPQPKQPTFTIQSLSDTDLLSLHNKLCSMNAVSVSLIEGR